MTYLLVSARDRDGQMGEKVWEKKSRRIIQSKRDVNAIDSLARNMSSG